MTDYSKMNWDELNVCLENAIADLRKTSKEIDKMMATDIYKRKLIFDNPISKEQEDAMLDPTERQEFDCICEGSEQ